MLSSASPSSSSSSFSPPNLHTTSSSSGGTSDDGSDHAATEDAYTTTAGALLQPPKRKRHNPQRATYHIRKDEILELQSHAENLEMELKALRYQTLVANTRDNGIHARPAANHTQNTTLATTPTAETSTIAKSKMTQQLLKDAVRSQQFALAKLQALLSNYSSLQDTSPLHMGIRLSRDFDERRATLAAARISILERAKRFISERSAGLDPLRAFAEQERFEDLHGAYCVTNFDVLPLPTSATSEFGVKSAHDMFCYLVRNVEITFSEWVGHITIRENEESPDSEPELGILVVDSVADDELYPYKPDQRVRRDTSGVFIFQNHRDTPVITRWSLSKTYPSSLLKNNEEMIALRSSLGLWGEKLLEVVYGTARRAAVPTPPMEAVDFPASSYNLSL